MANVDEGLLKGVYNCKSSAEATELFKKYIGGDRKIVIPKVYAQERIRLANEEGKCYFYLSYQTKCETKWFPFSNFYKARIEIDGRTYHTTETYFQCEKVNPKNLEGKGLAEEELEACRSKWESMLGLYAADAAKRGRSRDTKIAPDWGEGLSELIMHRALMAKFTQHKDLEELLLSTGDREIVEDTGQSGDYLWGIGADGTGSNLLGKALMKAREEIRLQNK